MSQGSLITQSARTRVHTHTRTYTQTSRWLFWMAYSDVVGLMHSSASTKGPEMLHIKVLIESVRAVTGQIISGILGGQGNYCISFQDYFNSNTT